jgi:hypothetical protein
MVRKASFNPVSMLSFGALLLALALAFIAFFESLPPALIESRTLAIDWQLLHTALQNNRLHYFSADGNRIVFANPPWTALFVLPLGWLSLQASWGLLVFATLLIEIVSVPRISQRFRYYMAILLLVLSWVSLRHAADGNFEGIVIAGVCLSVWAYRQQRPYMLALGGLLASAKPQITILFLLVLTMGVLRHWPPRQWLRVGIPILIIALPPLALAGQEWLAAVAGLQERGSIMDVSLTAALNRTEIISLPVTASLWGILLLITLIATWRTRWSLSREKAGMLLAAALLLAPYSAGNSVLSVLAVGIIPLFLRRPLLGFVLVMLVNATAFFGLNTQAYYTTFSLLIIWGTLVWRVWVEDGKTDPAALSPHAR